MDFQFFLQAKSLLIQHCWRKGLYNNVIICSTNIDNQLSTKMIMCPILSFWNSTTTIQKVAWRPAGTSLNFWADAMPGWQFTMQQVSFRSTLRTELPQAWSCKNVSIVNLLGWHDTKTAFFLSSIFCFYDMILDLSNIFVPLRIVPPYESSKCKEIWAPQQYI